MSQSRFGSEFGEPKIIPKGRNSPQPEPEYEYEFYSDDSWYYDSDENDIRYCADEEFNEQDDDSAFDFGDDNQEANENAFILDSVTENLDLDFAFDNNKAKGDKKRKAEEPLFSGRKGKDRKGKGRKGKGRKGKGQGKMKDHVAFVNKGRWGKGRWGKGRWNKGQGKDDVAFAFVNKSRKEGQNRSPLPRRRQRT